MTNESGLRPITMQDVRLAVGEGPLKPADVLAGCNAELVRRKALISPAGEVVVPVKPTEAMIDAYFDTCKRHGFHAHINASCAWAAMLSAAPRGMEG